VPPLIRKPMLNKRLNLKKSNRLKSSKKNRKPLRSPLKRMKAPMRRRMTSRERVSPMANSLRLSSKTPSLRKKMKPNRWVSTWRQRLSKQNSQRSKRRLQVTSRLVVNLVLAKKEHRTHWKVLKTLLMISIKFNPRKIEKLRTKQSSSLFRGMLSLSADKHQQLVDHQDPPSPEKSELEEESNLEPPQPPTMISPTRTNLTDLKRRRKDRTSLDKRRQISKTVVT